MWGGRGSKREKMTKQRGKAGPCAIRWRREWPKRDQVPGKIWSNTQKYISLSHQHLMISILPCGSKR